MNLLYEKLIKKIKLIITVDNKIIKSYYIIVLNV